MPTLKQKIVASKLDGYGGNITKAMLAAGYSPKTARTPQKLTKSKGWQSLMSSYLPEDKLLEKHKSILEASVISHYAFPKTTTDNEIKKIISHLSGSKLISINRSTRSAIAYFSLPDTSVQYKGLELAYKIRGRLNIKNEEKEDDYSQELEAVVLRIRQILPAGKS